ncbi:MAG: HAMP domain-containing histidine kinase [Clostridia bacterium]|nr:HAMP domain-containing histidine kinase [Clostridia bacterium]
MREEKIGRFLYHLQRYVQFFLLVGFMVTCCMLLFISSIQKVMGLTFTQQDIEVAAKLTFVNVIILTAALGLIDSLRRKWMVERPVKQILEAADKFMQGDFSVRIPPIRSLDKQDGFRQIAECFNRMAQELSGTETLRTDFIANVSHELKTPLAVIQNDATLLMEPGLTDQERQQYARGISQAARRLASLITNILKLNKLENQQLFPQRETFDLGEQLCQCLLAFEELWEEKGIHIQTELAESVQVEGDPELLSLVWNNLFSNALKFTGPGGTVGLSLSTQGENAWVEVWDTGCGFGPQVGKHLFEKFYQGDASHTTQGNGLGLALVKRVVDIVGGDIAVESEAGKGSRFTVKIRRVADAQA